MERITISRDDDLYEAFADIAQTPDGILVVTYRESLRHGPQPFSRVTPDREMTAASLTPASARDWPRRSRASRFRR